LVQEHQDKGSSIMEHICRILKDGSSLVYAWFEAMHTRIDIMLWDRDRSEAELVSAVEAVERETMRIERMASRFLAGSELSAINSAEVGVDVPVSDELRFLLMRCAAYCYETDGLFDVTAGSGLVGVLFNEKVRFVHAQDDGMCGAVARLDERVRLDLSGVLKGYAVDRVVAYLQDESVKNGLVNFGNSSIAAFGNHPSGEGWPVAAMDGKEYVLRDECLTTSGNHNEERKHIINPLMGEYVTGKGMVSVVTDHAEYGEVLSTVTFLKSCLSGTR
jgi:thiamine biosynthesis lipoprotein